MDKMFEFLEVDLPSSAAKWSGESSMPMAPVAVVVVTILLASVPLSGVVAPPLAANQQDFTSLKENSAQNSTKLKFGSDPNFITQVFRDFCSNSRKVTRNCIKQTEK